MSVTDQKAGAPVLVVDLDETLSRTDTLHEALIKLLASQPMAVARLITQRPKDKMAFKAYVADRRIVPGDQLVWNEDVLQAIDQARVAGQKVVLVSASDHRQVQAVADNLDIFDEAFGTGSPEAEGHNLGGKSKTEFLEARYGTKGFDYIGDCARDIPVWQAARRAYAVAPSPKLVAQASQESVTLESIGTRPAKTWTPYIKALRTHQWVKNVLVFLPMLAAQQPDMFWAAALAFVLFSLTASSVYIFNDLLDLASDRQHPRKRARPFAAGRVPLAHGVAMGVGFLLTSFVISLLVMPPVFSLVLTIYFAVTVAYSFSLKRKLIVDVIVLAGLYTMRILAGGAATGIMPSPWLFAFSVFLFYALATVKRQAELIDLSGQNKDKPPGRGYVASDVTIMQMISVSSGQASVLVFALYLYSPTVSELYTTPEVLWLICPVLLFWLSRIAILTHRGFMHDDPIVFAAKDKISLLTAGVVFLIILAAEVPW